IAREEDYDQPQSLFSSLLDDIPQNCVQEILSYSINAQYHIRLISRCWYSNKIDDPQIEASLPMYQLQNRLKSAQPTSLLFQYLMRFKQTPDVVQLKGPKQKYRFANNVDEFVNEIERFIENTKKNMHNQDENINITDVSDLLIVQHKGRQPKRYKSGSELPKKKAAKIKSSKVESKKRE
ncbi:14913_t:CDS:2, partial [Gigaspora margarita]